MIFSKFYSTSVRLTIDEIIVLYKEGSFSNNIYPRNTNVLASKFTNYVTRLDACMI